MSEEGLEPIAHPALAKESGAAVWTHQKILERPQQVPVRRQYNLFVVPIKKYVAKILLSDSLLSSSRPPPGASSCVFKKIA